LPLDVLDLLKDHARDIGVDSNDGKSPLIGTTVGSHPDKNKKFLHLFGSGRKKDYCPAPPSLGDLGAVVLTTSEKESDSKALGQSGIYLALKRYFRVLSRSAHEVDLDPLRFQTASTHWMRQTFARRSATQNVPLDVIKDTLGHASLNTTSVYLTTERSRMIVELYAARARRKHQSS